MKPIKASEIRVRYFPTLVPSWVVAQVIEPNTIWVNRRHIRSISTSVIAHELVHVEQQRRKGILRYWFEYARLLGEQGYENHKFEEEAHIRYGEYLTVAREILDGERSRGRLV